MYRIVQAVSLAGVIVLGGCHRPQPKARSIAATPARAAMDSAEIERLCLHPDSVRAGRADCVLKDQGIMGERRLPAPTTPPR
jgi:hypothetical protein